MKRTNSWLFKGKDKAFQRGKAALWGAGYRLYSSDDPNEWLYEHVSDESLMASTKFIGSGFLITFYKDIEDKPNNSQQLRPILKLKW